MNPRSFDELIVYQEWPLCEKYTLKRVERFEEPLFKTLIRKFFYEDFPGWDWEKNLGQHEKENLENLKKDFKYHNSLKLAAYEGKRLIGWTYGWQEGPSGFYMGSSGVLHEYRRKGIYSQMVKTVLELCREKGFSIVHSNHVTTNNAVIIAKLKLGFYVTGMELHDAFGTLLRLSCYLHPERERLIRVRSGLERPDNLVLL